jgi:Alpha-2,8-polysialyltransferase (POLYST)
LVHVADDDVVLCLVNGPWQALSLAAVLRERGARDEARGVLVDMDPASELHAATREVLRANGITCTFTIPGSTPIRGLRAQLAELEAALGAPLARLRTVYTYGVHRPVARYVLSAMPTSSVVVYEEGLRTYVPLEGGARERLRFGLAGAWGKLDREFGRAWTEPPQPPSARRYALLLGERMSLPAGVAAAQVEHIAREQLVASVQAVPEPALRAVPARGYGVIVGQYYARLAQLREADELAAYVRAARLLVERGLVPVWRGHIRQTDTLFEPLKAACPELRSFRELVADSSLPLECHASVFGPACRAVVSFSSSALFYLPVLYGTRAYTMLSPDQPARMNHPHRDACLLALAHVPPLDRLEEVP